MNKRAVPEAAADVAAKKRRILVVDGSRVVRATLAKRLGGHFEIVEEANGESAWQRLMLESGIAAVISGIHPPRLDARDLLARLKSSALRRLREMPFVLIVSDLGAQSTHDAAEWPEATGFITKSMCQTAMTEALEGVLARSAANHPQAAEEPHHAAENDRLLGRKEFQAAVASLAFPVAAGAPLCVMVFGIDRLDELTSRFGTDLPATLTGRIAGLLAAKVNPADQFGTFGKHRLAIISHGVDLRHGVRFAKRVCKSLAAGQIAVRGHKVQLTVSVGVASTSDDHVASGAELLALADRRLEQALACGGNTVSTEYHPGCPMHSRDGSLPALLRVLKAGADDLSPEQQGVLGIAVLPALRTLNARLSLGLPLADIERRVKQRAGAEEVAL